MRRAANVAERRSDKMNVFIFLITGIYLSVMAVIDHRLQKIPVLPGMIGILVIVLARVVDGDFWKWMPGVAVGVFLYLMSKATRGAVGEGFLLLFRCFSLFSVKWGKRNGFRLFLLQQSLMGW